MTDSQGFVSCSGASDSLRAQLAPDPVRAGTQRSGMMPFPKNQKPKRTGSAVASAYAVPFPLSMPPRRGRGRATLTPPASVPRKIVRREITLRPKSMSSPPTFLHRCEEAKAVVANQIDEQLIEPVSGLHELADQLVQGGGVRADRHPAERVLVNLADQARPGDLVLAQGGPQFREVLEG